MKQSLTSSLSWLLPFCPKTEACAWHLTVQPDSQWCLPLVAPGSCAGCSKTAHTSRVKEGRRSCCSHGLLCINTFTHPNAVTYTLMHGAFIAMISITSKMQLHFYHLSLLKQYKPCSLCYCKFLRVGRLYTYACHVQGTCKAMLWEEEINSFCFRKISLCHLWHLAARWWTPGWVWLSDKASPSPQSVHSSPAGPPCIQALTLQWLQLRRHPPPAQTQSCLCRLWSLSFHTWAAGEPRAATLQLHVCH